MINANEIRLRRADHFQVDVRNPEVQVGTIIRCLANVHPKPTASVPTLEEGEKPEIDGRHGPSERGVQNWKTRSAIQFEHRIGMDLYLYGSIPNR